MGADDGSFGLKCGVGIRDQGSGIRDQGSEDVSAPVDLWNTLLAGVDTSAMCTRLSAQMRERRLRFGDRAICPFLRPFFLDAADEARVRGVAEMLWTLGERVASVDDEVHDHLLDLPAIDHDEPRFSREGQRESDVVADEAGQHLVQIVDDLIDAYDLSLHDWGTTEGQ